MPLKPLPFGAYQSAFFDTQIPCPQSSTVFETFMNFDFRGDASSSQSLLSHGPRTEGLRRWSLFLYDMTLMLAFTTAVMHWAAPTITPHRHGFGAGHHDFILFKLVLFKVVTIRYSCTVVFISHLKVQSPWLRRPVILWGTDISHMS